MARLLHEWGLKLAIGFRILTLNPHGRSLAKEGAEKKRKRERERERERETEGRDGDKMRKRERERDRTSGKVCVRGVGSDCWQLVGVGRGVTLVGLFMCFKVVKVIFRCEKGGYNVIILEVPFMCQNKSPF